MSDMTDTTFRISGVKVALRAIRPEDADGPYFDWLQQPEVIAGLSSQKLPTSRDGLRAEIRAGLDRPDVAWFGICDLPSGRLIGTVRLSAINWIDRTAAVGILIGEAAARGGGRAREALEFAVAYGFDTLNLQKIYAGVASNNVASLALFRATMQEEGCRRHHVFSEGAYRDEHMFARFREA